MSTSDDNVIKAAITNLRFQKSWYQLLQISVCLKPDNTDVGRLHGSSVNGKDRYGFTY